MSTLFSQIRMNPPATEVALQRLASDLGTELPQDYIDFLRISDGGTGLGPDLFVNLDRVEDIASRTKGVVEFMPGLVVLGGDGLGNHIGIDARNGEKEYVTIDACTIDWRDVQCRTKTFADLLYCMVQE